MTKPMVSVVMITYGHEQFIKQAIEGVLMQQCDFEVEFIIANDCSPDNTDSVVDQLKKNYTNSNWIKYTRHTINKGMTSNFIWALQQAKGKYIAICEGDDYWTDPLKLKKQVDFLEANEEYVLCFTNRDILKNGILTVIDSMYDSVSFNKAEIPYIHVPTLTTVFRNVINKIPTKMSGKLIDASLFLFLSQFGLFYYFDSKTAIYRTHDGGIYSGSSEIINHRRSINARLAAWKYLKEIDKFSLADVLIGWIRLKKNIERSNLMVFSFIQSLCLEYYFVFYKKIKKTKL